MFQEAADLMDYERKKLKTMWGQFWAAHQVCSLAVTHFITLNSLYTMCMYIHVGMPQRIFNPPPQFSSVLLCSFSSFLSLFASVLYVYFHV